MQKDRKRILEYLQVKEAAEAKSVEPAEAFGKIDVKAEHDAFLSNAEDIMKALAVLDQEAPREKPFLSFLQGRKAVPYSEIERIAEGAGKLLTSAQEALELKREMDAHKNEIQLFEAQLLLLDAWLKLPEPETFSGTKKTTAFIGSISGEHAPEGIRELLAAHFDGAESDRIHIDVVFSRPEQTNFYLIALRRDESAVEEALRKIGFSRPAAGDDDIPSARKEKLRKKIEDLNALIESNRKKLVAMAHLADDFEHLQDYYSMRAEKYAVLNQLALSKHAFVLEGYVLERDAQALKDELESHYAASFEAVPAFDDEEAPVCLENNSFTQALEGVLESYSMPGPGEFDPLPAMSAFYYLMFGIMFSDAGYGLIMAGVCGVCLWKFKNMDENWKKNLRMFFWCGVSTVFWGVVFSSYFGDVVNVVSNTFFGHEVGIPPLWFIPMNEPMRMLIFCLAIGLAQLTFGYVLKGARAIKAGLPLDAAWDAALPILLIYPLIIVLMGSDMFYGLASFKLDLSPSASQLLLAVSAACMIFIVLTAGRQSKSWFKRILKGAYGLYNILAGWLSDTLSYSRLLALGLATGVIASIMNQLGAMGGRNVFGVILFVVVFLAGQAINFGINVLGAYVHSNRLEYVEFFGKFYDGGGRKFAPFGVHTKYIKIEEAAKNG
jgi:V/A-type H+-transporting ATPase subunit I